MNRVTISAADFRVEYRSEQNPLQIIPDDWNTLVAYVSRRLPNASSSISAASILLHNVEGELNRLLTVPTNQRGPNSSLNVRYNDLAVNLDNLRKMLNEINAAFFKEEIPTR